MEGLHLTADLHDCKCHPVLLTEEKQLAELCVSAVAAVGLTTVADRWHAFPSWQGQPGGVTGTVLLAESHLAIHTWPEKGSVTIDVYVCNFTTDNTGKARRLFGELERSFEPGRTRFQAIVRGGSDG